MYPSKGFVEFSCNESMHELQAISDIIASNLSYNYPMLVGCKNSRSG